MRTISETIILKLLGISDTYVTSCYLHGVMHGTLDYNLRTTDRQWQSGNAVCVLSGQGAKSTIPTSIL